MSSNQSSNRCVGRGLHANIALLAMNFCDSCSSFLSFKASDLLTKASAKPADALLRAGMLPLNKAVKILDPNVSDTATEAEIGHLIEIYEKYLSTSILHLEALTKLVKQYPQTSGFDGMLNDMLEEGLLVRIHMINHVAYAVSDLGAGVCKLHLAA